MHRFLICLSFMFLATGWQAAGSDVVKRSMESTAAIEKQLAANSGFETGQDVPIADWAFWQAGYELSTAEKHTGKQSIKCVLPPGSQDECGATQVIEFNQERPVPIFASGWSKAVGVSGSPDSNYSLYIDITYQDGTPLWGQTANFSTGTHNWERQTCLVVPQKPIKSLSLHAIFRRHSGTVYFDDFSLGEVKAVDDIKLFDLVSVIETHPDVNPGEVLTLQTGDGLSLDLSRNTGMVALSGSAFSASSGFLLRDVAAKSHFYRVKSTVKQDGTSCTSSGEVKELGLALEATFKSFNDHIRVNGVVADQTGRDRAVSLYFVLPLDAVGGRWYDDMRRAKEIKPEDICMNSKRIGAGANGQYSIYPLSCVVPPQANAPGACIAAPLNVPRLWRFAYDPVCRQYYAVFDFALLSQTRNFPSKASFSFIIYNCNREWGFRAALKKYYAIFPESFAKRVPREGVWMPFTDISTVERPEDFLFAFHEGNNNVPWDDRNNILSFVYTEPMTDWMRMPKDLARTYEGAMQQFDENLKSKKAGLKGAAVATRLCGAFQADGRYQMDIRDAPWCDGAVFALNANPDIPETADNYINQANHEFRKIERAFQMKGLHWAAYGSGYEYDRDVLRSGSQSVRLKNEEEGERRGASQSIAIAQKEAKPIVIRGWSKAEDVTRQSDSDYAVYVDLRYNDSTPLYGQVARFGCGTHDWQQSECVVHPEKPVVSATVYVLFRNTHAGTVWFDDLFVGEVGSNKNLLQNPGFEPIEDAKPVLDGTYVDSLEGWGTRHNYREEHFAFAEEPLVYDVHSKRPMILTIFSTYEFARELERRMRARGKLMMANGALHGFCWFAHLLDVMGTETNWNRNNQWRPMSDEALCFKRAMCYQKPYCFLMNTHFPDFGPELVLCFMKRSLFYGCFPGMFSENAATDRYFENPKWYNRDRPFFKKYVPLIQDIAKAGWEPITYARTDSADVYVERFGKPSGGRLFFTALNDSDGVRDFALEIDARDLGLEEVVTAKELVSEKEIHFERRGGKLISRLSLKSEDVLVIEF